MILGSVPPTPKIDWCLCLYVPKNKNKTLEWKGLGMREDHSHTWARVTSLFFSNVLLLLNVTDLFPMFDWLKKRSYDSQENHLHDGGEDSTSNGKALF